MEFYNKDRLNSINAVYLQYFLEGRERTKISVTCTPNLVRTLREARDRTVDNFDRLLKSITPQPLQTPAAAPVNCSLPVKTIAPKDRTEFTPHM